MLDNKSLWYRYYEDKEYNNSDNKLLHTIYIEYDKTKKVNIENIFEKNEQEKK